MRISEAIPERVALTQAAEEATELAQALLKLSRMADPEQAGAVDPKLTESDAVLHVIEEIADTLLCLDVVFEYKRFRTVFFAEDIIEAGKQGKAKRWAERLGIELDEEE